MEHEINKLIEEVLFWICRMVKAAFIGIFRGVRKLNCIRNIVIFLGTFLVPLLTCIFFKKLIFALEIPAFARYAFYYALLCFPFIYLFLSGSIHPGGKKDFEEAFAEIDFKGRDGQFPYFCGTEKEDKKLIYIFRSNIPVEEWRNRKAQLETAFDCTILKMENGSSKKIVRITTLPSDFRIPQKIEWKDEYIRKDSGVVTLGKSALEEIVFDLNRVPHVLIAGETGSGKSVILREILWQLINQGSRVYMFDFKGGVEFGLDYERYGEVVTERERALQILTELEKENAKRLAIFREMRVKNIVEYNRKTKQNLCRVGVFCDEVAEMLDKKGAPKELKTLMEQIEGKLSTLARLSRATGINLILGMQRPDANVLTGQIKNNIPVRISGRFADKTASEIVLGTTDAVNLPDIKGRFLYKMGNETQEFQAYYFDDETMLTDVFAEAGDMFTDMPEYGERKAVDNGRKKKVPAAASEGHTEPEATQTEFLVKPVERYYEDMNEEEFEAERGAMDEYDLNLDFF